MAEETSGAISGAAQGAAAGTMIMPGIGTAIGAVVGAIGGFMSGSKSRAARLAANKGKKIEREISYMNAAVDRRDLVRGARIARAQSVAASAISEGGLQSSAPRGAISSIGAQTGFNLGYFDWRISKLALMQQYYDKAGKYAAQASNIAGITSGLLSLASSGYQAYGASVRPGQAGYRHFNPPPSNTSPVIGNATSQYHINNPMWSNRPINLSTPPISG